MVHEKLLKKVSTKLREKDLTIATAESCSGGLIAHSLTNISGSSDYFDRGVVSYSNKSKNELLGVSMSLIEEFGAVSEPVAKAMAEGVRKRSKADIGISTTGIAGPTGGTEDKPVGLVFIAVAARSKKMVRKHRFKGTRQQIKNKAAGAALKLLLEFI